MIQALKGTGVALITPFKKDKSVDFDALAKVVNHVITGGVEYLVVLGTTGETATLTKEERIDIMQCIATANAGRVPMVIGAGGNNTHSVIEGFKYIDTKLYHSILSVSPYYNKPTQEGIFQHYKLLSENTPLPIILYNVPGRTGSNMLPETTLRIANECKNVIATKEASGNIDQIIKIIDQKPAHFELISGDDGYTLPFMSVGAIGVISVVANVAPRPFTDMVRAAASGDFAKAKTLHYKTYNLINSLFEDGNPAGAKAALAHLGIISNELRMPLLPASDAVEKKIINLLKSI